MSRTILFVLVLIPSVILHEVAHGAVALRFGDQTAKRAGRLTLNPIPHIDLFGTIILPTVLALAGGGVLGYAKPVPVDRSQMRKPRDHGLIVSLAGPATNIVLAVIAALVLRVTRDGASVAVNDAVIAFGVVNVVLAAFNLLPVPPLDGSAMIERLLPRRALPTWAKLRRYSMFLVLGMVFLIPNALGRVFDVAVHVWSLLL